MTKQDTTRTSTIAAVRKTTTSGIALMAALAAGCGDKAAPPDTTPPPAPEVVQPADVAPPAPPSRAGEIKALLERLLTETDLASALTLADEVSRNEPKAALEAARLRLVVVGRAAALGKVDVLGAGGVEAQLRLALAATEGAPAADAERVSKAARAMLGILTRPAEGATPAAELYTLLGQEGPEQGAVKDAIAVAFKAARNSYEGAGLSGFLGEFGSLTCEGCGVVPEAEAPAGTACAAASDAPFCEGLIAARVSIGPVATAPGNQIMLASLALADKLGFAQAPLALPVATPVGRTLSVGNDGLRPKKAPLMTLALNKDGLALGLRAVVETNTRKGPAEMTLEAAPVLPLPTLLETKADETTGAIAGVTDRLATVKAALEGSTELSLAGATGSLLIAVDSDVAAASLAKAIDGVLAAGVNEIALARGGQGGEAMAAHWRLVPDELARTLSPAWEKAMVVVVSQNSLDVYAPDNAREGSKQPGPEAQAKLPTSVEQGWRGEKLVRLRVPRPPVAEGVDTLDTTVLNGLGAAVKSMDELFAAGRLIHVVADEGALTGDVLRVGRHLQEGAVFEAIAKPEEVWPQASCKTPGCAGAVPVLLSRAAIPSGRGLKDKPEKGKKPADKPEPGPAPSAEFCNAADIKSQMAKKTAAFRFCYERELQLEKELEGRVTMSFIIGLSGNVKSVRVAGNALGSAKVADCLSKEIGKLQFKAPDGGECVVQWPFNFRKN